MERVLPHLVGSGILAGFALLGIARTRWRLRQPPGTILRWEKPNFKNVLGWFVIADGVFLLLLYVVGRNDINDIRWPVFSVGTVIAGAVTLRTPSYSELSEDQRADESRFSKAILAIMGAYAVARFLVGVLAPEQALIGCDLAFFCAALLWGVQHMRGLKRA